MTRRALILAAHGSAELEEPNQRIRELAAQIRQSGTFDDVSVAFHKGSPHFSHVLDELAATDVTVVPLMAARGYYCDVVLPRELRKNKRFNDVQVRVTDPVGAHPAVFELMADRAQALCDAHALDPAKCALAIVGHGTPKHRESRTTTRAAVAELSRRGRFLQVLAAFIDDDPHVSTLPDRTESKPLIVIPFLISDGPHVQEDLPRALGIHRADRHPEDCSSNGESATPSRRIICDGAIGARDEIIGVILSLAADQSERRTPTESGFTISVRADDSRSSFHRLLAGATQDECEPRVARHARRTLRLGARGSAMALWQARHAADLLRSTGADVEIVEISTTGDRNTNDPIERLGTSNPFCDDIEAALRRGWIDLAVHSYKDVDVEDESANGLTIAAILPRDDAREALVTPTGCTLEELPAGARIGTSSPRRRAQLLALRPDLACVPIRGPVDARIRQLDDGRFDGAILALAGLQRLGVQHRASEVFDIDRFLPAPAQGALAIQIRAGDEAMRKIVEPLDDAPTRAATDVERTLERHFARMSDAAFAAYAAIGDRIEVYAKLLSLEGESLASVKVAASIPMSIGTEVVGTVIHRLNEGAGKARRKARRHEGIPTFVGTRRGGRQEERHGGT